MIFIFVLTTVFSACCCFSVLNIFSVDTTGQNFHQFNHAKRGLLSIITLTDEEISICQNVNNKNVEELKHRLTEKELKDILSKCSLLLLQNSELFSSEDENVSTQSPQLESSRRQEQDFITEENSTIESSKKANGLNAGIEKAEVTAEGLDDHKDLQIMPTTINLKPTATSSGLWSFIFWNEGSSGSLSSVSVREQNDDSSSEKPTDRPENQREFEISTLSSTNEGWNLWNNFFGARGSSDSSNSVPVTGQNESSSSEKLTYDPENQRTEIKTAILHSTNTSWNLWNYFFGVSDSSNPLTTKTDIYFENPTDLENSTTENTAVWNIVLPGTKWCGSGDKAANDDDLGYFEDVDRCCRTHDKCDDIILAGESKYNLTNASPFTALNCKCDDELYDCLSKIDSVASNTVGNTFFNIFGRICYALDYPRICKKYELFSCVEYVIDETAEKIFQWKPAKKYLKMPFTISGR